VEKGANEGGPWLHFMNHLEIIHLAHDISSKHTKKLLFGKRKIVDIAQFRAFLVHLFVISILFVHFKRADEYQECSDAFHNQLNLIEFKLAIMTFCAAYCHEEFNDAQIKADFDLLHADSKSEGVAFAEVDIHSPILKTFLADSLLLGV